MDLDGVNRGLALYLDDYSNGPNLIVSTTSILRRRGLGQLVQARTPPNSLRIGLLVGWVESWRMGVEGVLSWHVGRKLVIQTKATASFEEARPSFSG